MTLVVEVGVTGHSRLELFPLRAKQDGAQCVLGRPATGAYLALSGAALTAVQLLSDGSTLNEAKAAIAREHPGQAIRLRPLLQTLLAAGLIRAVDQAPLPDLLPSRRYHLTFLEARHVAWVFSKPAAAAYATLAAAALAILLAQPGYLPRLADAAVSSSPTLSLVLLWAVSAAALAAHEMAHLMAATFLGVRASVAPGCRLFFPVLQTDLTDLWLVERRRRYLAYAAGMVNDVVLACAAVIALWLADQHVLPISGAGYRTVRLAVLVLTAGVLWQFNIYLRTDVYYLVANASGCHNLWGDAAAYLRGNLKRLLATGSPDPLRSVPPPERPMVRAFAVLMALGTAGALALGAACVGGLLRLLLAPEQRTQDPGSWPLLASLGMTGAWLAAAALTARRRRPRVHYRLLAPDDL